MTAVPRNRENIENGSWFLGDRVRKDGSMHVVTPMDPVFMVAPGAANSGGPGGPPGPLGLAIA